MKRKILLIILILLILMTISISILKITNLNKNNTIENQKQEPTPILSLTSIKEVKNCIDENNCKVPIENIYANIQYQNDNKVVQQWIESINKETDLYYQESIKSTTSSSNCSEEIKNTYKHSISIQNIYELYNGKKYLSLSVRRIKKNLCTNEYENIPIKVFLYDQQSQKEINQIQLKEELNISDDIIKEKIEENIKLINETTKTNFTIEDTYQNEKLNYTLYFNQTGELLATYYQNNDKNYYDVIITQIN